MKKFIFAILVVASFFLSHDVSACFTDNPNDAWLKLPEEKKIIGRKTEEILNYSMRGKEVTITIIVSPNVFDQWKEKCRFIFKNNGKFLEFHWDSELFMGVITYNREDKLLKVQALKYEQS